MLQTSQPFHFTPSGISLPLLVSPEELGTFHQGIAVTALIPAGFTYAKDVESLALDQSLDLLLLVPRAECADSETFQVRFIAAHGAD